MDSDSITVDLGSRTYRVVIGEGLLQNTGPMIHGLGLIGPAVIVTDEVVDTLYGDQVFASLAAAGFETSRDVIPSGEKSKAFSTAESLCETFARIGVDRSGFVVALGGGVVGDLAGFVASIYARGIAYVQVPTTVMAQVDSAVGGKTAINLGAGKNLVGSFYQPSLVIADTATLKTLPERVKNEGLAEVVKYGIIAQPALLDVLSQPLLSDVRSLVADCVSIKAKIVSKDERESSGERALLNFGHTFGHALETETGFSSRLLHGEAVALGMVLAFDFAVRLGLASGQEAGRVRQHLAASGLPTDLAAIRLAGIPADRLIAHMSKDKKVRDGRITLILPRRIGEAFVMKDAPLDTLRNFLAEAAAA
jgi:3-dehydroquinate synthase